MGSKATEGHYHVPTCVACGTVARFYRERPGPPWTCGKCDSHDARFRAGMTAMARFMTWVWMEAAAQHWFGYRDDLYFRDARHFVFCDAVESGRLALRWPDE